jgi:methyl-accepting chemotaxis protein
VIRKIVDVIQALAKSVDELARSNIALATAVQSNTAAVRDVASDVRVTRDRVEQMDGYLRPPIKAVIDGG